MLSTTFERILTCLRYVLTELLDVVLLTKKSLLFFLIVMMERGVVTMVPPRLLLRSYNVDFIDLIFLRMHMLMFLIMIGVKKLGTYLEGMKCP